MKAEERHELRENDLSNWLQYGIWAFLRQNGSYILLALALAFLGYQLWNRHLANQEVARVNAFQDLENAVSAKNNRVIRDPNEDKMSAAELATSAKEDALAGHLPQAAGKYVAIFGKQNATDPQKQDANQQLALIIQKETTQTLQTFDNIIETSTLPQVKARACLELARFYSELAVRSDLSTLSRPAALSKSYEYYAKALEFQAEDPLVAGKARLGMAGAYEDQGEWDKAKVEYQSMIADKLFAGSLFVDLAKDRLATLDDRRNAPRLAAWTPPVALPTPAPSAGTPALPGGLLNPGTSLMGPTGAGGSQFQGLMLGPPAPATAPALSPFNSPFSGGSFNDINPLPTTAPSPLTNPPEPK